MSMKHSHAKRALSLFLAILSLFSLLVVGASASTIADGSRTCTIAPVERHYFLTTTAGTRLGASAYQYTTNDGLTGPAYCIDHGLNYSSHALEIRGAYTANPATAAAFATGYPQHSLQTFLGRYPNDTMLDGLTETEYGYATQLAVWATLGQLAVEGTSFTSGRETVSAPIGDAQQARIFHAIQLILNTAATWDRIYQTGMYIRLEEDALGGNISIPGDMTLEFAADQEQYGIKREVIGGTAYYTREYIFASATSTYYSDYSIELWADGAPSGTMFVDTENHELSRGTFRDTATWTLPTSNHHTTINDNGFEYVGTAKLCIPVETAPNQGEITVRCGAYVMQYQVYLAHNEIVYEQSYLIADPSKGTQTANAVLKWGSEATEKGSLQITKAGGGGQALAGATFTLNGSDGSSRTGTTDSEGVIRWTELKPSVEYTLVETDAPAGYAIVDPINVTVQAARVSFVTVQDSTQKQLTIRKIDAQTGYSLRGATIAFKQIDGSFYTTAVTDHAGIIQFDADSLPIGSYEVYETAAPEGYELDQTVQTVNWDGKNDVTLTFRNVRKPTLIIYKCDTDNIRSLPGASFEVYRDGQLITTVTTNDNGLAYVPGVTKGYYTVKETVAPAGYVLDASEHSVYVDTYNPATTDDPRIVITNSAKPHLRILKYDAQTNQPISDTTFEVYRDGTLLGQYTTNAAGEIYLYDLTPGTYLVKEIAVKAGYVVNSTPQQIEIRVGTENYTLTFLNLLKPGIHLRKLDSDTLQPLAGAKFRVALVGGTFSREYTTDSSGEIDLTGLEPGAYEVTELSAPAGYLIDDASRVIQINAGENAEFVFTDTAKPTLVIEKRDAATGEVLAGATFRIARIGDEGHYLDRVTDRNGQIRIDGLEPGMFSVQEIAAPSGYVLNAQEYHVRLEAGKTSTLEVNNHQRPDLRIVKYDAQSMVPLSGVKFAVYCGTRLIGEYSTDANGEILLSDLDPGVYLVQEIAVPDTHVVNSTPQEIELVEGATETYNLVFLNFVKPGIHLIKLDSQTMQPLANARFRITQVGGGYSKEFTTDASGEIDLTQLDPGSYTVEELAAPDGYLIDDAARTIKIEGGENAVFVFTDTKKPSFRLVKLDSFSGERLPGATFRIAKIEDGTHYLDRITDMNGEINISDLEPGVYSVSELSTPEGYIPAEMEYHVELVPGQQSTLVLSNDRKPDLRIIKKDADTGKVLSGATFRINKADGSTLTTKQTDENGEIFLEALEPGVYQITETVPPVGYLPAQQPTQLITLVANRTGTVIFENHVQPGLTVNKIDSVTANPIKGAKFHITYGSNNTFTGDINDLGDFLTDENGQITLSHLRDGWYRVSELEPAAGYAIKDPAVQEIYIKAGESKTVTFQNMPLSALIVYKYDSVTGEAVEGAVFQVKYLAGTSGTGGTIIGTYKTSVNGSFTVTGLKAGTYIAEELASDSGHVIDTAPQTAYLSGKEQDVVQLYFGNTPKGSVVVKKVDAVTGAPLSGVEFSVTTTDGTVVGSANGKFVTDASGSFSISGLDPGVSIIVKETRAKTGYVLDDTAQAVTVIPGRAVSLEFRNYPKGSLIIRKYDSVTGAPLPGAEFKVTTSSGELVAADEGLTSTGGIYVTDEHGEIVLTKLAPATYVVTETKAPDNYKLDSKAQTVRVNAADTQTLRFYNEPLCTLSVTKLDSSTKKPLAGAEFVAAYSDGRSIGQYTTDKDGKFIVSGLVPNATVIITEEKAPVGYIKDVTPQHIVVKSGVANALTFENEPTSTLIIHKYITGTDNEPLSGVAFKVTDGNGGAVGPDGGVYYTDAKGEIVLTGLESGTTIKVQEIQTVEGFVLDGTAQDIEIQAGQVQNLTFWNPRQGGVVIKKLDSVTKKPLEGVTFSVRYSDGRVVDNYGGKISSNGIYTTNCNGEIAIYGVTGTLVITEMKTIPGYAIDVGCKTQTVTVNPDDTQYLTFYNMPQGGLVITKSDEDSGARIPGVKFEIRRMNGEIVGTYTTDRDGVIQLPTLERGWYTVTELKAADGYKLDATPQNVEVKDGQTAYLELTNVRFSGISIHKTDSVTGYGIYGVKFMVYDRDNRPIEQLVTDQNGYAYTETELTAGRYYVREIEAAEGYLADTQDKSIYVSAGRIATIEWKNTPITGQIQITKTSADYNSMNGWAAGTPIPNTVFEIYNRAGRLVDTVKTDKNGVAASKALPLGRYTIIESQAASNYALDKTPIEVEIEFAGQIVRAAMTNKSLYTNVSITKRGYSEVMPGQSIRYDFSGIANNSTTALESFYWRDTLPTGAVRLDKIVTGTWNAAGNYKIVYKTNYSADYKLLADSLSTEKNYVLDASPAALGLANGEVVTEFMAVFGIVPSGFRQVEAPKVYCTVLSALSGGTQFTNVADVGGVYGGQWIMAVSRWVTTVYTPPEPAKPLPRTGY